MIFGRLVQVLEIIYKIRIRSVSEILNLSFASCLIPGDGAVSLFVNSTYE